jgi:hypothetical protein
MSQGKLLWDWIENERKKSYYNVIINTNPKPISLTDLVLNNISKSAG